MVSEKTIIILITIAILLSAVSIAVTVSTVNTKMVPEIRFPEPMDPVPDVDKAQVLLTVNGQPGAG